MDTTKTTEDRRPSLTASSARAWLRSYSEDSRRVEERRRRAADPNRRLPMPPR